MNWKAVTIAIFAILALGLSLFIFVPAIQTRQAPNLGPGSICGAGALCGAQYSSLSCTMFGFGETYNTAPGSGYGFLMSRC